MGKLDLEVGGRQKKHTTNASIKQGKNHNFLTTMKAKKMKNRAVLFKLGYSYSVVLCLLSSRALEGGFFTELQVQIGHLTV